MGNKQTLIRLPEVKKRTGLSRSSIYLSMQRGEFPQTVPLGRRAVAWIESEVDAYIDAQIKQRGAA